MKKFALFSLIISFMLINATFSLAKSFKVGVHGPMTGPAAEVGRYIKNGALMARDDINNQGGILGKKVELVFGDTESKPEVGVSVYEKFITRDKVDVVIGGMHSSVQIAMQEVAKKYDKLFVSGAGASKVLAEKVVKDPKTYWMYFKTSTAYDQMKPSYRAYFKFLEKEGMFIPKKKTLAIIVEDTDFGRGLAESFVEAMKEDDWSVIANEVVSIDQADYTVQMSKLRSLKPDVLYTVQTSAAASASLCKSFRESGIRSFFMAIYTPGIPEYIKLTGKASETLIWGTCMDWIPANSKSFLKKYKDRFNEEPGVNAGLQYDAMMNVFAAMKLVNSSDSRKVAKAMTKIKNKGNMGVYQYDAVTHEARSGNDFLPIRIYQIMGGKNYAVYPDKLKARSYETQKWLK